METDSNLLFGVLALQADLLTASQFIEGCSAWAACKDKPLPDLLIERGWLTAADRADVDRLLERKVRKHGGDVRLSLAEVATVDIQQSLYGLSDRDIQASLSLVADGPRRPRLITAERPVSSSERYKVTRLHATGGLGRVWLAHDEALGRDVALKDLRPERANHPAVWDRFLKEARVTGQLEHPGIVPVYELATGAGSDQPFYTMRFVRGQTLAEAIAGFHSRRTAGTAGPLELRELLNAFVSLCNAVGYAHSRHVLHRDLKPQNVVLGDYGEVILLDWGLAKVLATSEGNDSTIDHGENHSTVDRPDQTQQGQILGTPAYMAPEQAVGASDRIGPRTDIYGLGATLYEILTGRPPFTGDESRAVLQAVAHDPPQPPHSLVSTTPRALDAICLKALAKQPIERYAAAKDLAEDVQRFLADEPVDAYPAPFVERAARWTRRHRSGVFAAATAVCVAAVSLAIASGLLLRANRETEQQRDLARLQRDRARQHFQLARQAVDVFHTEVSESAELRAKGSELLQRTLLGSAADFYKQFSEQEVEDLNVKAEQGSALVRLGNVEFQLGRLDDAERSYQQAAEIGERLVTSIPTELDFQRLLAIARRQQGEVARSRGRSAQAEQAFQRALDVCERLLDLQPSNIATQRLLAETLQEFSLVYSDSGRGEQAKAALERSQAIYTSLRATRPHDAGIGQNLAAVLQALGYHYYSVARLDLAERYYDEALRLNRELVELSPDEPEHQEDLISAIQGLSILYSETDRPKLAESAFAEALEHAKRLAETHPQVMPYQTSLAQALNNIAVFYRSRGENELAAPHYRAANEVLQGLAIASPDSIDNKIFLSAGQLNFGNLTRDLRSFDESIESYVKARQLLEKVLATEPQHAFANMIRPLLYANEALTLARLSRIEEAQTAIESALNFSDGEPPSEVRRARAMINAVAGKHAEAMSEVLELSPDPSLRGQELFELASICAIAATAIDRDATLTEEEKAPLRDRSQVEAMALLHKAAEQDFFQSQSTIDQVIGDGDFTSLKARDDFRAFAAELKPSVDGP
jgi:serine/threonine-protein kinase